MTEIERVRNGSLAIENELALGDTVKLFKHILPENKLSQIGLFYCSYIRIRNGNIYYLSTTDLPTIKASTLWGLIQELNK